MNKFRCCVASLQPLGGPFSILLSPLSILHSIPHSPLKHSPILLISFCGVPSAHMALSRELFPALRCARELRSLSPLVRGYIC